MRCLFVVIVALVLSCNKTNEKTNPDFMFDGIPSAKDSLYTQSSGSEIVDGKKMFFSLLKDNKNKKIIWVVFWSDNISRPTQMTGFENGAQPKLVSIGDVDYSGFNSGVSVINKSKRFDLNKNKSEAVIKDFLNSYENASWPGSPSIKSLFKD